MKPTPAALAAAMGIAVLAGALADVGRGNQQQLADAGKGRNEAVGIVIRADADINTECLERLALLGRAHQRGNLAGGHCLQQAVDDEAAELAIGTGDEDGGFFRHDHTFMVV